ncbi:Non-specific serine/threonine protein kinase protein [Dioscorea alata]|uniref:Non-specific serine/threonine protein kinase protein n=1 Tax=Dioscorea alata TaxID=55571 RepID=A0ACB7V272_DIOAL|nr:Non-specific serine/threonine protein kinase protein [Dioscorea alata]
MGNSCVKRYSKCEDVSHLPQSPENLCHVSSTNSNKIASAAAVVGSPPSFTVDALAAFSLKSFALNDLKQASKNFNREYFLGEGEFGCVFKGWIDKNTFVPSRPGTGIGVAIKKLKPNSFQGHQEWLTEVTYLAQLRHENLVKLIGYCLEGDERLIVYEHMQRGSLDNHLFRSGALSIPWATRVNIAIDVARGVTFLHSLEIQVIYRDLKAGNVLLNSDFKAKLSDFGLARNGPAGNDTHVSTRVVGTYGYAAPEYVATGRLSAKSDVYSFGVLLIDLFSGRRAEEVLRSCRNKSLIDKWKMLRFMSTGQDGEYTKRKAQVIAELIVKCLQVNPKKRPDMNEVLCTLEQLQTTKARTHSMS